LRAGEPAPVDAVVDVPVDAIHDLVHLVAEVLGIQVRCALAVVPPPLRGQVERQPGDVVGDDLPGRDVHDRGDGDPLVVSRVAGEVGLLEPLDPEHGVPAARVEVEGPAPLVVRRPAYAHAEDVLETEEASHDDRAVRPRAGARDDETVAVRLDRVAVAGRPR
jgi:hypothetical protein